MAFELYATVLHPTYETKKDGTPARLFPIARVCRVKVGTYATKQLAQWWAINVKRVWIDPPLNITIVTERSILGFDIVEVP